MRGDAREPYAEVVEDATVLHIRGGGGEGRLVHKNPKRCADHRLDAAVPSLPVTICPPPCGGPECSTRQLADAAFAAATKGPNSEGNMESIRSTSLV